MRIADITGKRFGNLTALNRSHTNGHDSYWMCVCDCGAQKTVLLGNLRQGKTRSCGKHKNLESRKHIKGIIGKTFGRLTVISREPSYGAGKGAHWLCVCSCGNSARVRGSSLTHGHTKSCGCLKKDSVSKQWGMSSKNGLFASYKYHAKQRGFEWRLSIADFIHITQQPCYYCGIPPSNLKKNKCGNGDFRYSGVDRMDSSKGYTSANVVPCCRICNRAKLDLSFSEFTTWLQNVAEFRAKKAT